VLLSVRVRKCPRSCTAGAPLDPRAARSGCARAAARSSRGALKPARGREAVTANGGWGAGRAPLRTCVDVVGCGGVTCRGVSRWRRFFCCRRTGAPRARRLGGTGRAWRCASHARETYRIGCCLIRLHGSTSVRSASELQPGTRAAHFGRRRLRSRACNERQRRRGEVERVLDRGMRRVERVARDHARAHERRARGR